jgi:hypothetical protein
MARSSDFNATVHEDLDQVHEDLARLASPGERPPSDRSRARIWVPHPRWPDVGVCGELLGGQLTIVVIGNFSGSVLPAGTL